jgi:small subunit ribosomal protein S16
MKPTVLTRLMLKMRFKRVGRKRQPSYRLVVMLSTAPRDGKVIKELGFYNPITKELKLDLEGIKIQLNNGVKTTKVVENLLKRNAITRTTS